MPTHILGLSHIRPQENKPVWSRAPPHHQARPAYSYLPYSAVSRPTRSYKDFATCLEKTKRNCRANPFLVIHEVPMFPSSTMLGVLVGLTFLPTPSTHIPHRSNSSKAARKAARLMHAHSALLQLQLTLQKASKMCGSLHNMHNVAQLFFMLDML